jgi:hypothetical protein
MKNLLTKLTITLMAAGTLFATTGTALADTKPAAPAQTSTTLVTRVNRDTNLATKATVVVKHDLTPKATKLAAKSTQNFVLDTIDTSAESISKAKYAPTK